MRSSPALLAVAVLSLGACSADPVAPTRGARSDAPSLALATGNNTEVVTEADVVRQAENTTPTGPWVLYTRLGTPATAAKFDAGPGTAPLGVGSLHLTTATSSEKVFLFNFEHVGTPLADISAIGYQTFRTVGSAQQVAALNMVIDFNGPAVAGGFTTLVFEPVYNATQGTVVDGAWQSWNAFQGRWWSTRAINGMCSFDCWQTWSDIVANNPDATILGGFGVNQGSGNPGLIAAVDALTLGVGSNRVTYDFEPYATATTRDACKDAGWQTVKRSDGSSFKNQGECVAYVNSVS